MSTKVLNELRRSNSVCERSKSLQELTRVCFSFLQFSSDFDLFEQNQRKTNVTKCKINGCFSHGNGIISVTSAL